MEAKTDRRVQRTRQLLKRALVQLIKERGYDTVSIQDITERANLGRTTFYLHYESKEALLLDHHEEMAAHFNIAIVSRADLMGDAPQREMVAFLHLLTENRGMYLAIRAAKEAALLMRGVRAQLTANLKTSLTDIFPGIEPEIPLDVLAEYIVGAQEELVYWWMTHRTPYDAVGLATLLQRLRRAAICDAYRIR